MRVNAISRGRCSRACSRKSRRCRRSPEGIMKVAAHAQPSITALDELTAEFLDSYLGDERARRISHRYLPSREAIVEILESVLDLMYPGYFGRRDLNRDNLGAHVAQSVAVLAPKIEREMEHCLCYGRERDSGQAAPGECAPRAHELAQIFLGRRGLAGIALSPVAQAMLHLALDLGRKHGHR